MDRKYTVTVYAEDDHSYNSPIGEVDIRATDYNRAIEVAQLMFDNTGRAITVWESSDEE